MGILISCSKCGSQFEAEKFDAGMTVKCPECGESVKNDVDNRKPCPRCGEQVMASAVYCKHCKSDIVAITEKVVDVVNEPVDRRNAEFVMGLLGGIFGIIGAFSALMFAGVGAAFKASGAEDIGSLSVAAIFLAIWGIIGAALSRSHGKLGGLFMLASAIGGVIAISMGYLLSGVLLGIAGVMSMRKQNQSDLKTRYALWIPITIVIFTIIFMIGVASKPTADIGKDTSGTQTENAAIVNTSDTTSQPSTETETAVVEEKPKLELLSHSYVNGEFSNSIDGTVRNNSAETIDYVEIVFNVYDENEAMLGTTMANITGLEAGATWKYSAMVTDDKVAKYKLAKLGDSAF